MIFYIIEIYFRKILDVLFYMEFEKEYWRVDRTYILFNISNTIHERWKLLFLLNSSNSKSKILELPAM